MNPYENLHIDILSQQASPVSQNFGKVKAFMRLTTKFADISPNRSPKIDPETYEYWYHESKKYLKQVIFFFQSPFSFVCFYK